MADRQARDVLEPTAATPVDPQVAANDDGPFGDFFDDLFDDDEPFDDNPFENDEDEDFVDGPDGTPGPDRLIGSEEDDRIRGLNGNDTISAGAGDDTVEGNGGNDAIDGGPGFDDIFGGLGNDQLAGNVGDDFLNGQQGRDAIVGGFGQDTLAGGNGNDVLSGGPGADAINGGSGLDTAVYNGPIEDFDVRVEDNGVFVTQFDDPEDDDDDDTGGTDALSGVERVRFDGDVLLFDTESEEVGYVYRLYEAAFNRDADDGITFWIDQFAKGAGRGPIADQFVDAPEFEQLYGEDLSDAGYVQTLYQNVLDRGADSEGEAYWTDRLGDDDFDRSDMLVAFSESLENRNNTDGELEGGLIYEVGDDGSGNGGRDITDPDSVAQTVPTTEAETDALLG